MTKQKQSHALTVELIPHSTAKYEPLPKFQPSFQQDKVWIGHSNHELHDVISGNFPIQHETKIVKFSLASTQFYAIETIL